jgi:hypothetical protein
MGENRGLDYRDMSTEIKWRAVALAAGISFTLFFTGCGGGGGGDGTVAPESLEGRSYDFSPNTGGQTAVTFASATSYTFMHETGAVDQGTYEAARNENTWTVTLSSETGGQQLYTLNFGTGNGGNFTLRREGEEDRFGPFTARGSAIPIGNEPGTTTGDPPGSTTTPGPEPSNVYNGFAPVSIAGRVMAGTRTQTSTGPVGQTHTYTFGNGTFHDSDGDEQADGTYTYVAGNSSATLNLVYTAPQTFNGDKHDLTMTFTQKDSGRFTSTYTRQDQTQITISGNFVFEPIP